MPREAFDVVIVGSGMAGGVAAQQFCEAGLRVLVVEAGGLAPSVAHDRQISPEKSDSQIIGFSDHRIQARCYAFNANTRGHFANDVKNPYCTNAERPFSWIRARAVGGKSLLWAGHCYRMGDVDFAAALQDGMGESWPLGYAELAPYYDEAEQLLQVVDAPNRFSSTPQFGEIGDLTSVEGRLHALSSSRGFKPIPAQVSHNPNPAEPAKPCIHCGAVSQACLRPVTSSGSTLAAAFATGLLTLWTHAQVHTVTVAANAKATGVAGINADTGEHFEAAARVVFLCASALESTRILLNSTSSRFPHGLGNSSGVLGHYLMDHVSGIVIHAVFNNAAFNTAFFSSNDAVSLRQNENRRVGMFYIPRWQNLGGEHHSAFLRGYGYQGFILRADHDLLACGRMQKRPPTKETASSGSDHGIAVRLVAFGEMLPNYDNHVEIDKTGTKDTLGVPALRIDCRHDENEKAMARDMVSTGIEYLEAAGGRITEIQDAPWEPGLAIHEAGTCRMGKDPETSILNSFNQSHEVPNVFVTDASCFPSIGTQNPALTIVALTIRACRYALQQLRQAAL